MTPTEALQQFIFDQLTGSAEIVAMVGTRIYDDVPPDAVMPYVSLGQSGWIEDDADCIVGLECFLTVHTWSRYKGGKEIKRLNDFVKKALHHVPTDAMQDHALCDIWVETVDIQDDPSDSLTRHGVIRVEALVEEVE